MIARERLLDLVLGARDDEAEEHVLSCDACAAVLAELAELGSAIADHVASGSAVTPATPALRAALERDGLITRTYELVPGGIVPCGVSMRDIYVLTRLAVDLRDAKRVDLLGMGQRLEDMPFTDDGVMFLSRGRDLRQLPTIKIPLELIAVDDTGERSLGTFTLDHTAS
jgi:hypothetical protein